MRTDRQTQEIIFSLTFLRFQYCRDESEKEGENKLFHLMYFNLSTKIHLFPNILLLLFIDYAIGILISIINALHLYNVVQQNLVFRGGNKEVE